jgi:GTP-binding protein
MEDLAVQDAMRAMKVADVAVLVLDAQATKLQRQELAIADAVVKEGRALVVVANKQDLVIESGYSNLGYQCCGKRLS